MNLVPFMTRAISIDENSTQLNRILRAIRTHLDMDVAFIAEFVDGHRVFREIDAAEGCECIKVEGSDPLGESYCYWVAEGRLPKLIRDPADHPLTAMLPATNSLPVGAHLSVPIRLRDGNVYGTFCCFSFSPDRSLTSRDLSTAEAFAQVAGELIDDAVERENESQRTAERISLILATRKLDIVYQPAIRLDSPGVAFVEALARFPGEPYEPPNRWFAAAARVGLTVELEMLAVELALEGLAKLPAKAAISINISPETVQSAEFTKIIAPAPLERIILEITEHDVVTSYAELIGALQPLRAKGLRLAVDDTGATYSTFRHMLLIRPDMVKLDMSLGRGIDFDPARRALASALITFAREIGSEVVAEGVETAGELRRLRELGVTMAQGHFIARPGPPGAISAQQLDKAKLEASPELS